MNIKKKLRKLGFWEIKKFFQKGLERAYRIWSNNGARRGKGT